MGGAFHSSQDRQRQDLRLNSEIGHCQTRLFLSRLFGTSRLSEERNQNDDSQRVVYYVEANTQGTDDVDNGEFKIPEIRGEDIAYHQDG